MTYYLYHINFIKNKIILMNQNMMSMMSMEGIQNQAIMNHQQFEIILYQEKINKLIQNIIERECQISLYKNFQKQMMDLNEKQNQFMYFTQQIIEHKKRLYQEKINKLNEEMKQKDMEVSKLKNEINFTINNINKNDSINKNNNQINNQAQINPINNNTFTPQGMWNPIILFNFLNQNERSVSVNQQNFGNLILKLRTEDGNFYRVPCRFNDILEIAINNYCSKLKINKENYDFFIIKEQKAKIYASVEENGINENDCYILAKKKEVYPEILGEKIFIFFIDNGIKISLVIGEDNSFKDAVKMFCRKIDLKLLDEIKEKLIFLFNGMKLNIEDCKTLKQIGIKNFSYINVFDGSRCVNII